MPLTYILQPISCNLINPTGLEKVVYIYILERYNRAHDRDRVEKRAHDRDRVEA